MKSEEQNPRRVAIVADGIVSPLGFGLTETLQSLQQGRDCVTPVSTFSVEKTRCKTAAQIDDGRLLSNANRRRQERRLHRASYMVMLLTRFEPAATNEFWRAVMTRCPSSCSLASIHYKRRRRKNVDPLIRIAPAWYWAKARPCLRLKNSSLRAGVARKFLAR